jgi:small subunit ribosomal protein S2
MALVDTNCDPDPIQYVIACNDDALKSIKLIIQALAQAIIDVKNEQRIASSKGDEESEEEKEAESEALGSAPFDEEQVSAREKE